jgi:hypothetical protein
MYKRVKLKVKRKICNFGASFNFKRIYSCVAPKAVINSPKYVKIVDKSIWAFFFSIFQIKYNENYSLQNIFIINCCSLMIST